MRTLRRLKAGEVVNKGDKFVHAFGRNFLKVAKFGGWPANGEDYRPICPRCSKNGESEYTDLVDGQCPNCGGEHG